MSTVSRCICYNRSFKEIKDFAEQHGYSTVEELKSINYCSNSCGLCAPYVELMFETGETEFDPRAPYRK